MTTSNDDDWNEFVEKYAKCVSAYVHVTIKSMAKNHLFLCNSIKNLLQIVCLFGTEFSAWIIDKLITRTYAIEHVTIDIIVHA